MKSLHTAFGRILRELREARGFNLNEIGEQTGYGRGNWHNVETGKLHASDPMLKALAPLLGLPFETLKAQRIVSELTPAEREALRQVLKDY